MKIKVLQFIIIITIVFMLGGILSSVKTYDNNDVSEVISDYFENSDYDGNGNSSIVIDESENINIIGKVNEKVGKGIIKATNDVINFFYKLVKKLVS